MFKKNGLMKKMDLKNGFEVIPRSLLQHERLSLQAIGLLCNLASYPDDWVIYKSELYRRFPRNKETSVRNAFNELVEEKYIIEIKERDGKKWSYSYYYRLEPFTIDEIKEIYISHDLNYEEILGTGKSRPQNNDIWGLDFEVPKMETSKSSSNKLNKKQNTHKQNTHIKNLSIKEKLITYNFPNEIENVLLKKIDRLIDYKFNVDEIYLDFKANRKLSDQEYAQMLNIAISEVKNPILKTTNFLRKAVATYLQTVLPVPKAEKEPNTKLPSWLKEEKSETSKNDEALIKATFAKDKQTDEDRKRIEKMLADLKSKNNILISR